MNSDKPSRFQNLSTSGRPLIDFGSQPVSNRFLADDGAEAPVFPLALRIDEEDGLIHVAQPFPVEELRPRFSWMTCFEPEAHLDDLVTRMIALPGITKDSSIGAYSFKDDTTLRRLEKLGYANTWRLEPVQDLGVSDPLANVETYQKHFTPERAAAIRKDRGAADIFIVRHVLEHSYDLTAFLEACQGLVRPGGYVIFEVPDCARALQLGDFTTIWEEHVFYFTPHTLRSVLVETGFDIQHFESVEYPFENSLIAITGVEQEAGPPANPGATAAEIARAEKFAADFAVRRRSVRKLLEKARADSGPIAMFGAGHLSVAYLSLMGLSDLIDFVIDDNPNKRDMKMPVGSLPILGSQALYEKNIRLCLLSLNPQNQPKVIANHARFTKGGGKFASIFPGSALELETVL